MKGNFMKPSKERKSKKNLEDLCDSWMTSVKGQPGIHDIFRTGFEMGQIKGQHEQLVRDLRDIETKEIPMQTQEILNSKPKFETAVLCAVCRGSDNHLEKVTAICGADDDYESTHAVSIDAKSEIKIHPEMLEHEYRLRGLGIIVSFNCENGHTWHKTLMFHKGKTFEENIA